MPDDDLTQSALCFELRASWRTVQRIAADLGIEPRRTGTAMYYTLDQVARIRAEHTRISGALRNARTIRT